MGHKINYIEKNSIAEELDINIGDELLQVNGKDIHDILEYIYEIASEYVELTILKKNGEVLIYEIEKNYDEKIGCEFKNPILDEPNSCKNKCIFCFIDQLPKGMRKSLYFKDDDSRLSFLHGNYITLTNLSEEDINRIIELKISPINISVHTTNPELRLEMIKNPKSKDLMPVLKRFSEAGITVNGQIVLCPDYNDGDELNRTMKEIYSLGENFANLAIVPVGLSKHREGLTDLRAVNKEDAINTIKQVEKFQKKSKKERGNHFVYLSDEFYITADHDFPSYDSYDGFPQLENGVGLTVKLNKEVDEQLKALSGNNKSDSVTIITGVSASDQLRKISRKINKKYPNIKIEIKTIINEFFGEKITVAGLITGIDILKQVDVNQLGDKVIIPEVMLKSDEDIFLDDVLLTEIEEKFNHKIIVVKNDGYELINRIIE
jgi:putative radical SAM enzyme (TIGR03279 family)